MSAPVFPDSRNKKKLVKLIKKKDSSIPEGSINNALGAMKRLVSLFQNLKEPQVQKKIMTKIVDGKSTTYTVYSADFVESVTYKDYLAMSITNALKKVKNFFK